MPKITPILLPKETVNDEKYLLVEIAVENGQKVEKDEALFAFESSKTAFEILSPTEGYVYYDIEENDEVAFGELIAVISSEEKFPKEYFEEFKRPTDPAKELPIEKDRDNSDGTRFSKPALELIVKSELEKSIFYHLKFVKKSDVQKHLSTQMVGETVPESGLGASVSHSQRLLILGGGGHAKICIDILKQMKTFEIAGIIDPSLDTGSKVLGVPIIGRDEDLPHLFNKGIRLAVIGVGAVTNHRIRDDLFSKVKQIGFYLPNLIHPKSSIEPSVIIGEGNQIMANAAIGSAAELGNNCIVNVGSVISHDTTLEDNVHIAPGAVLAGRVSVGANTLIGMGVNVYLNVSIGSNVVIYNGINVNSDITDGQIIKARS